MNIKAAYRMKWASLGPPLAVSTAWHRIVLEAIKRLYCMYSMTNLNAIIRHMYAFILNLLEKQLYHKKCFLAIFYVPSVINIVPDVFIRQTSNETEICFHLDELRVVINPVLFKQYNKAILALLSLYIWINEGERKCGEKKKLHKQSIKIHRGRVIV